MLDEACDEPSFTNWDPGVSCGEIPAVIYEALDDYLEYGDEEYPPQDIMSNKFYITMKNVAEKEGWNLDNIWKMQSIIVRYCDGSVTQTNMNFDSSSTLLTEVELSYIGL